MVEGKEGASMGVYLTIPDAVCNMGKWLLKSLVFCSTSSKPYVGCMNEGVITPVVLLLGGRDYRNQSSKLCGARGRGCPVLSCSLWLSGMGEESEWLKGVPLQGCGLSGEAAFGPAWPPTSYVTSSDHK